MTRRYFRLGLIAALLPLISGAALAQPREPGAPPFPANPAAWINSEPITLKHLEGKAALIYFFEESCPKCRARWPELMTISKKFADQPIVFIAVNSGNPPRPLKGYARRFRVRWPLLVDYDRSYEKALGVNEISLKNIHAVRLIMPDGSVSMASSVDIEGAAQKAVKDAEWNVDPAGIPSAMRSAWEGVEYGNYPAAAVSIKRNLRSSKEDLRAAAEKLNSYVTEKLNAEIAEAEKAEESGDPWTAYKIYSVLPDKYEGYDVPGEVLMKTKELRQDETVVAEIDAYKRFTAAKKQALSRSRSARAKGFKLLDLITIQNAGTEAAKEATKLLVKLRSNK